MSTVPTLVSSCIAPDSTGKNVYLIGTSTAGKIEAYLLDLSTSPPTVRSSSTNTNAGWRAEPGSLGCNVLPSDTHTNGIINVVQFGRSTYQATFLSNGTWITPTAETPTNTPPTNTTTPPTTPPPPAVPSVPLSQIDFESPQTFTVVASSVQDSSRAIGHLYVFDASGSSGASFYVSASRNATFNAQTPLVALTNRSPIDMAGAQLTAQALPAPSLYSAFVVDKSTSDTVDIFMLDTRTAGGANRLARLIPSDNKAPKFQAGQSVASLNSKLVIYGGQGPSGPSNDVYMFDILAGQWTGPTLVDLAPSDKAGNKDQDGNGPSGSTIALIGGIAGGVVLLLLLLMAFYMRRRRTRMRRDHRLSEDESKQQMLKMLMLENKSSHHVNINPPSKSEVPSSPQALPSDLLVHGDRSKASGDGGTRTPRTSRTTTTTNSTPSSPTHPSRAHHPTSSTSSSPSRPSRARSSTTTLRSQADAGGYSPSVISLVPASPSMYGGELISEPAPPIPARYIMQGSYVQPPPAATPLQSQVQPLVLLPSQPASQASSPQLLTNNPLAPSVPNSYAQARSESFSGGVKDKRPKGSTVTAATPSSSRDSARQHTSDSNASQNPTSRSGRSRGHTNGGVDGTGSNNSGHRREKGGSSKGSRAADSTSTPSSPTATPTDATLSRRHRPSKSDYKVEVQDRSAKPAASATSPTSATATATAAPRKEKRSNSVSSSTVSPVPPSPKSPHLESLPRPLARPTFNHSQIQQESAYFQQQQLPPQPPSSSSSFQQQASKPSSSGRSRGGGDDVTSKLPSASLTAPLSNDTYPASLSHSSPSSSSPSKNSNPTPPSLASTPSSQHYNRQHHHQVHARPLPQAHQHGRIPMQKDMDEFLPPPSFARPETDSTEILTAARTRIQYDTHT
ncbi:hypothetical protein BGZ73_002311 [Actinomortierella ambigua]|nr:hypothetical protein BGZ73_002311 [Actinomortierella ambigua]